MFAALENWEFAIIFFVVAVPIIVFGGMELFMRLRHRRERLIATRDKSRERLRR